MIPLFVAYPPLRSGLSYFGLGAYPTPVVRLNGLGPALGATRLFMKRDDLSAAVYGGNKMRKLEFMLGQALQAGKKGVLTFGYVGSNHSVATSVGAERAGLACTSLLYAQPKADHIKAKLLLSHACGAELYAYRRWPRGNRVFNRLETAWQIVRHRLLHGTSPYVVPWGGTSPLGTVGYVNAVFELKQQVDAGELPAPDVIYVVLGTMGTAAGLFLGLKAVGLTTRLVAVPAVGERFANERDFLGLLDETAALLRSNDASFPVCDLSAEDRATVRRWFDRRYTDATTEVMEAIRLMRETEGIELDVGYTGKAIAALREDLERHHELRGQTILYWNTCNSRDFSNRIASVDYRRLPRAFHLYFQD